MMLPDKPMNRRPAFFFFIAVLALMAVLADLLLWFSVSGSGHSFEQSRQEYLSYYPSPLQNARLLTVISILLLTLSGFVFLTAARSQRLRVGASVLGLVCAVLMMWKIFSLM